MHPKLDSIFSRRSIRKYTDEPVTEEEIQALLEAGMLPPYPRAGKHPEEIGVQSLISIGRPAESKPPRTQFKPAKVHREKW